MSEGKHVDPLEDEETLLIKHRTEKRELQARIQQLKKSINKDKKKKKEITKEIGDLEDELTKRHAFEILQFENAKTKETASDKVEILSNGVDSLSISNEAIDEIPDDTPVRKISKAEKRRQKKVEASKEREALIQEEIANSKYSARNVEADKLKGLLKKRHYKMYEIEPDGNCMYAAISHQINNKYTVQNLRAQAAIYMKSNVDDFAPFLSHPDTGDMLTPEQFDDYCDKVENTSTWGGEPELKALSQCLQRKFEVIQAEGAPRLFGEEFKNDSSILLPYYRHYYGLGEHYNSVILLSDET